MTDLLEQIILAILAVGAVFLVLILWRLYLIITDTNTASSIFAKRIKEADEGIDNLKDSIKNYKESIAGFFAGLKGVKKIKELFFENNNKKEDNE